MIIRTIGLVLAGALFHPAMVGCNDGTSNPKLPVDWANTAAHGPMALRIYSEDSLYGYRDPDGVYVAPTGLVVLGGEADNLDTTTVRIWWTNEATGETGQAVWIHVIVGGATNIGWISWQCNVPLTFGDNRIVIHGADNGGRSASGVATARMKLDVQITIPSGADAVTTPTATQAIGGTASDGAGVSQVTWLSETTQLSGVASGTTSWSAIIPLVLGPNMIVVTAQSASGLTAVRRIQITYDPAAPPLDTYPPVLTVAATSIWNRTNPSVMLVGTVSDDVGPAWATWTNEATGQSGSCWDSSWNLWVTLAPGVNRITVTAHDNALKTASQTIDVTFPYPWPQ